MARSSQDPSYPSQRRRTIQLDAKDIFLYDRDTRHTNRSGTLDQSKRESSPMQHDSRRRLGDRNNRPRYTDNGDYSSKNEGVSSLPTARGRNERASTGYTRPPPTTSRALQPQISLTNLFEDTQHTQAQYPKSGKKTQDKSTGKGRIRSISDTSIYSRTENINFDNTAATKTKKVNINEDEVKLIEDQNDTRQVLTAANNGRQDGSENEIGDKTISLTEFAKLEEIVPVKQIEVKEKTLVERAEPLIQDLTLLYEKEWDQAIISEERLYKEIAMSLGTLLDHEMMEAAHIIKDKLHRCMEVHETVKKAAIEESNAAKTSLLKLLEKQKQLILQYNQIQERISKRDEKIISEIRIIHTNSLEEQQRILNEYITKADTLDDKIEVMRDEKTLTNDFNRYLEKSFGSTNNRKDNNNDNNPREEIGTSSITEKNKNARRATRA